MSIQITMPALSPTMEEGNLTKWHVKAGDRIEPGQVIAEIETDKATMEVEAVDEGVIAELLVAEGAQGVKVNTPIAVLAGEAPQVQAPAFSLAEKVAEKRPDEGRSDTPTSERARAPHPPVPSPQGAGGERRAASPLARRLASQSGIDLSGLVGSGPHGRVVKRDIEAAQDKRPLAAERSLTVQASAPSPALHKTLEQQGVRPGSYDLVPLDLMRKTIAKRMSDSFRDVPHFPLSIDIEIDALLKARGEINKRFGEKGVKISINDMCIKAAALALKLVPESNASYTPDGIALHHHADIAVAVAIPHGLITPIIWQAETKGLAQISHEMADLAERARNKKLKPEEFQGGTFSLSNMGMLGIKSFASIINEPHGMIMSIGAVLEGAIFGDHCSPISDTTSQTVARAT